MRQWPQVYAAGAGYVSEGEEVGLTGGGAPVAAQALDLSAPDTLREILEHVPTPIAALDGEDGRCLFANTAFRVLGAVRGQGVHVLFPALEPALLEDVRRGGQTRRLRTGGPDRRQWDIEVAPLRGGDGGTVRGLLVTAKAAAAESVEAAEQHAREVSHRVKNTLQLVSSLLTLQALSSKDPEIRRAFQDACARIGTVTQAHQRIHTAGRGGEVEIGSYLRAACAELEAGFSADGGDRRIEVSADDTPLPVDAVIPLALIVNELVGNATRHAYPPGVAGVVEVSLLALPTGGRRLTVADRGRGLPPGFEPMRVDTLGLKIARAFTGQLKGKLRAESNEPGARFVIDLPF